jgi:hypothetical protein
MKYAHKRNCISKVLAALVLISLCACCASTLSVSAARGSANVQAPALAGASLGGASAVCAPGTKSLALFVRGTDAALWYNHWDGTTWSSWTSLGGVLTSDPATTSSATGHIDVVVRGSDGALWQKTTTDGGTTWSNWISLGGVIPAGTGPAACSWGAGRLDVFVQGTTGALYHKSYTGSWSGWQNLGGALSSSPAAAAASGSSRIDVVVRGSDGALWQKTYNGGWSGWTSIGGMSQIQTQTIYYVPQAGSAWANQGVAGTSYNAYVSTPSLFRIQSNGYPYWGDTGQNDFTYIPAGSATNNQNVASWEIGFHLTGISSGQRFQKIWDKACGGFMIEIDTALGANQCLLTIYRATTGGSGARWYIPTDTVLRTGHNYYIQIAWNTSAGPGHEPYPTVWIGEDGKAPVHQTDFDESGGALGGTGSWYNDAVGGANLGNTASDAGSNASAKTAWLDGGFFVYRQYNSIVDFSNGGSWNTDKLRWT